MAKPSTTSTWVLDGYKLTSDIGVRDVESRDGWDGITAGVGGNGVVGNRSGELWQPKRVGPSALTLNIWFTGEDEAETQDHWEAIVRVAAPVHRLVDIVRIMPVSAGSTNRHQRTAKGELAGVIQPQWVGRQAGRAQLTFVIPGGLWKDTELQTYSTAAGTALPHTLHMQGLVESTGPCEDGWYQIVGPITNPRITETTARGLGDWVQYNGTVPAGAKLVIDSNNWGYSGEGFTPNAGALIASGPRFVTLHPAPVPTWQQVQLSGSGGGATTQLIAKVYSSYR